MTIPAAGSISIEDVKLLSTQINPPNNIGILMQVLHESSYKINPHEQLKIWIANPACFEDKTALAMAEHLVNYLGILAGTSTQSDIG